LKPTSKTISIHIANTRVYDPACRVGFGTLTTAHVFLFTSSLDGFFAPLQCSVTSQLKQSKPTLTLPPCIRNNNNDKHSKKSVKRVKFDAKGTRLASEITDGEQWQVKGFRRVE
jgi:hypothetical protein